MKILRGGGELLEVGRYLTIGCEIEGLWGCLVGVLIGRSICEERER